MMTNALPSKSRAYRFATKPTASAPTAADTSLCPGNLVPVKWLHTQPMHETTTSRTWHASRLGVSKVRRNMGLAISRLFHGAWKRRLSHKEYMGTVRKAATKVTIGMCEKRLQRKVARRTPGE